MPWTLFEYLYRDAGNFKAFGCVALEGRIDPADEQAIRAELDSGEYFIAEQIGVPPLYEELYQWSGGPTASDHWWHELVRFRESASPTRGCTKGGNAADFVRRFTSLNHWDISLSPHFDVI